MKRTFGIYAVYIVTICKFGRIPMCLLCVEENSCAR